MADNSGELWQLLSRAESRAHAIAESEGAGTPELLFHYTGAKGLHGILDSRALWATQFEFLNDSTEYIYGQRIIEEYLQKLDDQVGRFLGTIWPKVRDLPRTTAPHFVVSTCSEGDSLSQWRGYGRIHDSYAIALRRTSLASNQLRVIPLIYSLKNQRMLLEEITELARERMRDPKPDDTPGLVSKLREIVTAVLYVSYFFKDPSFSGEKEWRIVVQPAREEKFRVVGGQIVPYVEIPLAKGAISHIVQGPGVYRTANGPAIERLAAKCGFEGVKVNVSDVPLV